MARKQNNMSIRRINLTTHVSNRRLAFPIQFDRLEMKFFFQLQHHNKPSIDSMLHPSLDT